MWKPRAHTAWRSPPLPRIDLIEDGQSLKPAAFGHGPVAPSTEIKIDFR
jgi:hypothetical protein